MPEPEVKVLDFGLAKPLIVAKEDMTKSPTVTRMTEVGAILGTAPYMSPEQWRGQDADERTDLHDASFFHRPVAREWEPLRPEPRFERLMALTNLRW